MFRVDDLSEMSDIAEKISTELRNQYVIGYNPKDLHRDGKWRKVKVKLNPPPGTASAYRSCTYGLLCAIAITRSSRFCCRRGFCCRHKRRATQQAPAARPARRLPHRGSRSRSRARRPRPQRASIQREKEDGGYVLRTDVEEVVLNCTVLDGSGASCRT